MKTDFKTTLDCYRATREFRVVTVPTLRFLMVDGHGGARRVEPSRLRTILRQPVVPGGAWMSR